MNLTDALLGTPAPNQDRAIPLASILQAQQPTWADAAAWHGQNMRDTWSAMQQPQTWVDAAKQYGNAMLMGSTAPGSPKTLAEVQKAWDDLGISHHVAENGDYINVSKIVVPDTKRGQGVGTSAMQTLLDYADANGKTVALTPSKDFGASSMARLTDFYKRLGFVSNAGRKRDFATQESMIRSPAGESGQ